MFRHPAARTALLLIALTPLLIASFAFNFNNFNNIYLLTGGGPTMEGSEVAGATDILELPISKIVH